jgi:hypothetical protein
MAPAEVDKFEAGVCETHKQTIDSGAEWTYDTVDRAIYIGPDVAAAAHHVVRTIRLSHLETLMPDLDGIPIIANFACRTRGSQECQTVSLVFTQELALALIDAFGRLIPPQRIWKFLESRLDE